jgi:hypothetical protein
MDVVEGETGPYSETGVTCDVCGTEEVGIDDATVTKVEIPEPISFPDIKAEPDEVSYVSMIRRGGFR